MTTRYSAIMAAVVVELGFVSLSDALQARLGARINYEVDQWARLHLPYYPATVHYERPVHTARATAAWAETTETTGTLTIATTGGPDMSIARMIGAVIKGATSGETNVVMAVASAAPYTVTLKYPTRLTDGETVTIYERSVHIQPTNLLLSGVSCSVSDYTNGGSVHIPYIDYQAFMRRSDINGEGYPWYPTVWTYDETANVLLLNRTWDLSETTKYGFTYYRKPTKVLSGWADAGDVDLPDSVMSDLSHAVSEWLKAQQGRINEMAMARRVFLKNGNYNRR